MKHTFSFAIVLTALILLSFSNAKSNKMKIFPNAGDVVQDYYAQNTVNYAIRNNLAKSEIDLNPGRYVVLNGLTADKDPNMVKGEVNKSDSTPYYPYYDPKLHPFVPPQQNYVKRHSQQDIYQKDKAPYYGPTTQSRILNTTPNDGVPVRVEMGDLSQSIPTIENIAEQQSQLDQLNQFISGPKKLLSDDKTAVVYQKDPNAYYDPTSTDILAKKAKLEGIITDLKKKLNQEDELDREIKNKIDIVKTKGHVSVENKVNTDMELDNEYIANNFYYPVNRDEKPAEKPADKPSLRKEKSVDTKVTPKVEEKKETAKKVEIAKTVQEEKKIEKKEEKKVEKPEEKKIEKKEEKKVEKPEEKKVENKEEKKVEKPEEKKVEKKEEKKVEKKEEKKVEKKEEKKVEKKEEKKVEKKEEKPVVIEKVQPKSEAKVEKVEETKKEEKKVELPKRLDTQGMKTERVRIVSLRKNEE